MKIDKEISNQEDLELIQKIREGDQDALEKLTNANLRFVVSVSKQYQNQGLSLSDLINEGNVGLMKAARRFDETKGFKFISERSSHFESGKGGKRVEKKREIVNGKEKRSEKVTVMHPDGTQDVTEKEVDGD